jgi:hypothetical protein
MGTFGDGRIMARHALWSPTQDPTTINLIAVGLTAAALVACSSPAVKSG